MTTRLLIAVGAIAVAALSALLAAPTPASGGNVVAAEYCYTSGSLSVQGRVIYPGGEYCVPGP